MTPFWSSTWPCGHSRLISGDFGRVDADEKTVRVGGPFLGSKAIPSASATLTAAGVGALIARIGVSIGASSPALRHKRPRDQGDVYSVVPPISFYPPGRNSSGLNRGHPGLPVFSISGWAPASGCYESGLSDGFWGVAEAA